MKKHKDRYVETSSRNPRFRLTPDEADIISDYRRIKKEAFNADINVNDIKHGWLKTENSSLFFKNPDYKKDDFLKFKDQLINDLKEHSPVYEKIKRDKLINGHLLVIDPADVHIGKLCKSFVSGQEYDKQTAVIRCLEGVKGIIDKCRGFHIDKIILIAGNDILHVDGPSNKTTKGTLQDVDSMWYDNFLTAKRLYIKLIEMLISLADVHFMYNPSNHDYMSGFFLADVISTHFKNNKNISFDVSLQYRKYYKYYDNLIGSTHGDGAKQNLLPMLMADESKDWSRSKYRYIYTHHVHHKTSKDFPGVSVESLRSPSEADAWHHKYGYSSSNNKAIEGFIHHPKHGQVARLTHLF